jgi:hypothetical protein
MLNFSLGGKSFHIIVYFNISQIFFYFETCTQYIAVYLHHDLKYEHLSMVYKYVIWVNIHFITEHIETIISMLN